MKRRTTIASLIAAGLALTALLAVPAFSGLSDAPLFASLRGQNEIPDADPDGRGGFTAIVDGNQFCYGLTVTNIDQPIVGAHIHRGNAGENGPVVIPLTPPSTSDPGASSACTTADPGLLQEILQRPSQFYVNVHTGTFPGGAIRDQLRRHPR
ncbi:MAG TPA: CHRD domain-containing protein [Actinomycetota bacterium]|nr:CHRD domain-containing protein [Actinomycetota bacterium]